MFPSDGGGNDNFLEYLFGTDPTDSVDRIDFSISSGVGGSVLIELTLPEPARDDSNSQNDLVEWGCSLGLWSQRFAE